VLGLQTSLPPSDAFRRSRQAAASLLLAVAAFVPPSYAPAAEATAPAVDWKEQYAYSLGMQAYVFGFPYVYLPTLRWAWVNVPQPPGVVTPYAALNHFHHVRNIADASYRDGGSPNNDTLYSVAWVDVSRELVILSHPDMGDRYFTFELASLDSDNFAYVGKRTTGSRAGSFAIVGPNWKGTLPAGVRVLEASRTPSVSIIGRTLIDGPADVATVNALQDEYSLVPLSYWGKKGARLPESRDVWKPFDPAKDPLAEWKTMNRAMTEEPPEPRLAKLVESFGRIVVGPGREVAAMDPATKRGLARAAVDGRKLLDEAIRSGELGKRVNGWNIPPAAYGRAGLVDDFLLRASVQCLGGIVANDPDEAVYFNTALDASGAALDSSRTYSMRFAPGQLPDVGAFWSITMYDPTYNLTPNPINRYSIGNRTKGLRRDPDGGLTIYIGAKPPGGDRNANWLPSPASGGFSLIMRTYMPGPDIVQQKWAPPPVARSNE
jgi:hypothetical protein